MPYLRAKDELVSLNRLSSRGLWKWYNSKVLDRRLYGVAQHFTFCRFSRKKEILWKLWSWFSKMFHERVFSDRIWRISKFLFWRQILDIYRQPLLSELKNVEKLVKQTVQALGCVQTDATTPNIVAPTMLGVIACVLAVVCKRMQQLPTSLGPAVHRGKNTTPKSL